MTELYMEDIKFIRENILTMNIEICGNILLLSNYKEMYKGTDFENIYDNYKLDRGILWYDIQSQTANSQDRMCNHDIFTKIMFHTHSYSSKFYPSKQDIVKYIFSKETQTNIIFTSLGIWDFKALSNDMYNIKKTDDEKYERLKRRFMEIIDKDLTKIYRNTYHSRLENIPADKLEYVKLYLKNIFDTDMYNKTFKIQIKFTPWDEIQNHYTIF